MLKLRKDLPNKRSLRSIDLDVEPRLFAQLPFTSMNPVLTESNATARNHPLPVVWFLASPAQEETPFGVANEDGNSNSGAMLLRHG